MFKVLFFAALMTALIPFVKTAQTAAAGYAHMQSTAAMLADPLVQRDYSKFAACVAAVQREGAALTSEQTHSINADPAKCQQPTATGPRWVAVR